MNDFEYYEVFNSYDEPVKMFYQWDIDQTLKIVFHGAKENLFTLTPEVHFTNAMREEALVVRATVSGDDTIIVDVPNLILTERYDVQVYVYVSDNRDANSQRSIVKIEIPLIRRDKPSDYYYVENIDRVTANIIKQEIKNELIKNLGEWWPIVESLTFIDQETREYHKLFVSGGKFKFEPLGTYADK